MGTTVTAYPQEFEHLEVRSFESPVFDAETYEEIRCIVMISLILEIHVSSGTHDQSMRVDACNNVFLQLQYIIILLQLHSKKADSLTQYNRFMQHR